MTYKTYLIKKDIFFYLQQLLLYVCRKKYHKSRQVFNHHSHFLKIGLNSAKPNTTLHYDFIYNCGILSLFLFLTTASITAGLKYWFSG